MSADARWTVGTGLTVIAIVVTLFIWLGNRIDGLDERLRAVETDVATLAVRVTSLEEGR